MDISIEEVLFTRRESAVRSRINGVDRVVHKDTNILQNLLQCNILGREIRSVKKVTCDGDVQLGKRQQSSSTASTLTTTQYPKSEVPFQTPVLPSTSSCSTLTLYSKYGVTRTFPVYQDDQIHHSLPSESSLLTMLVSDLTIDEDQSSDDDMIRSGINHSKGILVANVKNLMARFGDVGKVKIKPRQYGF